MTYLPPTVLTMHVTDLPLSTTPNLLCSTSSVSSNHLVVCGWLTVTLSAFLLCSEPHLAWTRIQTERESRPGQPTKSAFDFQYNTCPYPLHSLFDLGFLPAWAFTIPPKSIPARNEKILTTLVSLDEGCNLAWPYGHWDEIPPSRRS